MAAHHGHETPVEGPLWTRPFIALAAFTAFAMLVVVYRFAFGIGAVSALNDGYAWGTWKIINVVVLTAVGSGGFATAVLVYFLNRQRYHSLVRVAILTSAMAYTTGVIALGMDIGRPWNFWVILKVWEWNLHSVLLEIAVCVSLYIAFLWVEMAVPMLERWRGSDRPKLRRYAETASRWIDRAFPWIIAMAILLPTMHQSSLGSLFLLSGPRIHPLWNTDFLPLLFLISAFFMGWGLVIMAAQLSAHVWRRPLDMPLVASLGRITGWVMVAFLAIRFADLAWRGAFGHVFTPDLYSAFFLIETGMLVAAAVALLWIPLARRPDTTFLVATTAAVGGSLYRFNTSLTGFMPGAHWSYFPSVLELVITLGFMTLGVLGYIYIVKRFPILAAGSPGTRT
jgi:Ni/Fe-hydrogenase subunit HybB-like protein